MKKINLVLASMALIAYMHVGTLAVPRPTLPAAVASINVTACSNGTSDYSARFHHGVCDLAPKQYWDKKITTRDAVKTAETTSTELVKRENAVGYTSWISQMFLNMASLGNRLPITSFLTGHPVFLSDTDVANTAAVKHKFDKLAEAKNTKITDEDHAEHGHSLHGQVNSGRVSAGISIARLNVSLLPAAIVSAHGSGDTLSSAVEHNDLSPADNSGSYLSVLDKFDLSLISKRQAVKGFETGEGAVYVDKVHKRDASDNTDMVAAEGLKTFIHDIFAPFTHSDLSDSSTLVKRNYLQDNQAYDAGHTSSKIIAWCVGVAAIFTFLCAIYSAIKWHIRSKAAWRDAERDASDPNAADAGSDQPRPIPDNINEADMLTDNELRAHICPHEGREQIHLDDPRLPAPVYIQRRNSQSSDFDSSQPASFIIRHDSRGGIHIRANPFSNGMLARHSATPQHIRSSVDSERPQPVPVFTNTPATPLRVQLRDEYP